MTQRRKTKIIIIIIELSFSCGACHRCIIYWCFACNLALCASAVSLVSFNRSTIAAYRPPCRLLRQKCKLPTRRPAASHRN